MPTTIYGPQEWTAGDFSEAGSYQSTSFGGADTPITGYPELAAGENFLRSESAGPDGQHVVDAVDTGDYTVAGIALTGLGPLTSSQYDGRSLIVEWSHKLLASGLAEADHGQLMVLTAGGSSGSGNGLFSADTFLRFEIEGTSGSDFNYELVYRKWDGSSSGDGTTMTTVVVTTGTADDAWHDFKIKLTPSTVTGAFAGNGTLGSAVSASDGRVDIWIDGVAQAAITGLNFTVNYRATTNPEVYYGRGLWHGFSDLLGPVTSTWLYYEADHVGCATFGYKGTVTGTRSIIASLDGNTNTLSEDGKFKVFGDFEVTGTSTFSGTVASLALDDLSDVAITSPALDQGLRYNGSAWVNDGIILRRAALTLTDAEIKALPTTPITLIAAPGAGFRISVLSATVRSDTVAGAYTNIDSTYSAIAVYWLGDFSQWATVGVVDDSSVSLTRLSSLLGGATIVTARLTPYLDAFTNGWAIPNVVGSGITDNTALAIAVDNNGSGAFTGGNSANTLEVTVYYTVEAL